MFLNLREIKFNRYLLYVGAYVHVAAETEWLAKNIIHDNMVFYCILKATICKPMLCGDVLSNTTTQCNRSARHSLPSGFFAFRFYALL